MRLIGALGIHQCADDAREVVGRVLGNDLPRRDGAQKRRDDRQGVGRIGKRVAVLLVGGYLVVIGNGANLTPGELVAFYMLMNQLFGPVTSVAAARQTIAAAANPTPTPASHR